MGSSPFLRSYEPIFSPTPLFDNMKYRLENCMFHYYIATTVFFYAFLGKLIIKTVYMIIIMIQGELNLILVISLCPKMGVISLYSSIHFRAIV